jgi:predicted metal-binding protein
VTREPGDLPSIRGFAGRGASAAVASCAACPSRLPSTEAKGGLEAAKGTLLSASFPPWQGRREPETRNGHLADATISDTAVSDATIADTPAQDAARPAGAADAMTIYVCVTCRGGQPLDGVPLPGEALAAATARAAEGTGITVRPVRCLANCNRGLSAAVRRDGAWTYVFGGLDPSAGAAALIEGARLFADAPDGLMPWRGRPDALKRGLVARTPPF